MGHRCSSRHSADRNEFHVQRVRSHDDKSTWPCFPRHNCCSPPLLSYHLWYRALDRWPLFFRHETSTQPRNVQQGEVDDLKNKINTVQRNMCGKERGWEDREYKYNLKCMVYTGIALHNGCRWNNNNDHHNKWDFHNDSYHRKLANVGSMFHFQGKCAAGGRWAWNGHRKYIQRCFHNAWNLWSVASGHWSRDTGSRNQCLLVDDDGWRKEKINIQTNNENTCVHALDH